MKIGIITFHRALSYGAGYQTWALARYLKNLGHAVEIINYIPTRFTFKNLVFGQLCKKSLKEFLVKCAPYVVCKTTEFITTKNFAKKHLTVSGKTYKKPNDLTQQSSDYDLLITGSDQVWNLKFDTLQNIKPYLLNFENDKSKKISYASSIGMDSFNDITDDTKEEFARLLSGYKVISVRESSAVELLKTLGVDAKLVLDPTFLLNGDDWRSLAKNKKQPEKYVFVYGLYRNKELHKFANNLAKAHNLKVINLATTYDFNKNAKNKIIASHEEVVGYINNAECVVTDSFHGTALSVNMQKPLYIFPAPRYNTRLESLIKLLGLESHYVLSGNQNLCDTTMDYTEINAKLEEERKKSYEFLGRAINE